MLTKNANKLFVFFCLFLKEIGYGVLVASKVLLGNMGVDLVHGSGVGPAAHFHDYLLRDLQGISQGRKAVTQAVDSDVGNAFRFAGAVHLF